MLFQRATKKKLKLRMAIPGPPGSGKTYSALRIGRALVGATGRIAVIDTERGSASKYSDIFDFDVLELDTYEPEHFVEAIRSAENAGYDLLIPDSLSHAWFGTGGMLDKVDKIARARYQGNPFAAWKDANPSERALWDTLLACNMHVIATLRTKTEYVMDEQVGRDGKKRTVPRKVGLAPIQRDGLEYEFDVIGEMSLEHDLVITKTRCHRLTDQVFRLPGEDIAEILSAWLNDGEDCADPAPSATPSQEAQPAEQTKPPKAAQGKRLDPESAERHALWVKAQASMAVLGVTEGQRDYFKAWTEARFTPIGDERPPLELVRTLVDDISRLAAHVGAGGMLTQDFARMRLTQFTVGEDPVASLLEQCASAEAAAVEAEDKQESLL